MGDRLVKKCPILTKNTVLLHFFIKTKVGGGGFPQTFIHFKVINKYCLVYNVLKWTKSWNA